MAVLPEIPGLEVTVQVKKSNLPEFDIPINNNKPVPSEVTKYIQSAAGSTFRLKWELKKDFLYSENDIALDVYLDGSGVVCKSLNKRFLRSLNRAPVCHYVKGAESFTGKEWIRREFIFSELTVGKFAGIFSVKRSCEMIDDNHSRCICRQANRPAAPRAHQTDGENFNDVLASKVYRC